MIKDNRSEDSLKSLKSYNELKEKYSNLSSIENRLIGILDCYTKTLDHDISVYGIDCMPAYQDNTDRKNKLIYEMTVSLVNIEMVMSDIKNRHDFW